MALTDKLVAIADAIRSKTGKTDSITLDGMAEAVSTELEALRFPNKIEFSYPNVELSGPQLSAAIYGDGMWFTASGNDIYTSTDGIIWDHTTTDLSMGNVCRMYANGVWVNCAGSKNSLYYSTDRCKTWTPCNVDNSLTFLGTMKYCNGHWYVRCSTDKLLYHSFDGKTWEPTSLTFINGSIHYANGVYMAEDDANSKLWKSTDGVNFTEVLGLPSELAYGKYVRYFNGIWLCHDSRSQKVCYSNDNGETWTLLSNCPAYSSMQQFGHVLIGNGSSICVSEDGLTWNQIEYLSSKNAPNIYIADNVLFASTNGRIFYYTFDLITWYECELPEELKRMYGASVGKNVFLMRMYNSSNTFVLMYSKLF